MNGRRFEISVGDPWDFAGPDGPNRIVAELLGTVRGPGLPNWGARYLLLSVCNPFEYHGERVEFLVASPRYQGDSIDRISELGGTVGIARLRPGRTLAAGEQIAPQDVEYVIIGGMTPVAPVAG